MYTKHERSNSDMLWLYKHEFALITRPTWHICLAHCTACQFPAYLFITRKQIKFSRCIVIFFTIPYCVIAHSTGRLVIANLENTKLLAIKWRNQSDLHNVRVPLITLSVSNLQDREDNNKGWLSSHIMNLNLLKGLDKIVRDITSSAVLHSG